MNSKQHPKLALRDSLLHSATQPMQANQIKANKELIQLVQFARNNSSYWRAKLPNNLIDGDEKALHENLSLLPITTRRDHQENYDQSQIVIPGSSEKDYAVTSTTGSTGIPARVKKYLPTYMVEFDAITLMEWYWFNRDVSKTIVKMKYGQPLIKKGNWGEPLSLLGEAAVGYDMLTDSSDIPGLVKMVIQMNPTYLYSYPSTLTNMAHELMSNGDSFSALTQVLTASETLEPWQRELFAQAYPNAQVVDRYSSEEFGYMAMQCPISNHLHVLSRSVAIEIVNENNEPCEVGELGRLLVTGLHTPAQPLIRYEIGDLARWGEPTDCGISWPVIDRIEGRVHEFKQLPDGTRRRVALSSIDFGRNPKLREFKVVLFNNAIVALLSTARPFSQAELSSTQAEIAQRLNLDLPVIMRETNIMPLFKRAKRDVFEIIAVDFSPDLTTTAIIEIVEMQKK